LDKRDLAIDSLSKLVNISYTELPSGIVNVNVGARALVSGNTANTITATPDATNNNFLKVVWTSDNANVTINNGELAGALYQRDTAVSGRITQVNSLASTLISQVNAVHTTGVGLDGQTGRAFFSGTDATDIAVNPIIAADVNRIGVAANQSTPPAVSFSVGDGSVGLQLAGVADALTMNGNTTSMSGYWTGFVSQLGTEFNQSKAISDAQNIVLGQVTDERSSTSGVSLDQEATDLIRFQHAYEAAARVITTVDTMLDTVINGMGRVGR
jgi:flagellar hook-associated protein 1 FlgK